jgi:hypothetical protein
LIGRNGSEALRASTSRRTRTCSATPVKKWGWTKQLRPTEIVEGMQFDRGYVSPYFVTNVEKMRVDMEDPYILIYEKKLSGLQELLPLLEAVVNLAQRENAEIFFGDAAHMRSDRTLSGDRQRYLGAAAG